MQNTEFVESLRYLGEAALEAAQEQRFTDKSIEGVKTVCLSNMILYIASELIDLSNYAAIDKKRDTILVSDIDRVIKNDEDLNIAFHS
jgi:histone H3/H4